MRGELDAIYWKLHSAFLRNRRDEADRYLAMLDASGNPAPEIGPAHATRLGRIRERMASGEYGRIRGRGSGCPDDPVACCEEPTVAEREFCARLLRDKGVLEWTLGAEGARWYAELDMDEFGRCDLVLRRDRTVWVVEVKMGEAKPAVVSQVDKYALGMELDMSLGTHDEVVPVVLAGGFPRQVLADLLAMPAVVVAHEGDPGNLRRIAE